jgi:hypothetical protein
MNPGYHVLATQVDNTVAKTSYSGDGNWEVKASHANCNWIYAGSSTIRGGRSQGRGANSLSRTSSSVATFWNCPASITRCFLRNGRSPSLVRPVRFGWSSPRSAGREPSLRRPLRRIGDPQISPTRRMFEREVGLNAAHDYRRPGLSWFARCAIAEIHSRFASPAGSVAAPSDSSNGGVQARSSER